MEIVISGPRWNSREKPRFPHCGHGSVGRSGSTARTFGSAYPGNSFKSPSKEMPAALAELMSLDTSSAAFNPGPPCPISDSVFH